MWTKEKKEKKETTDFRKAKEEARRTISATSITLKNIMAALEKDLGVYLGRRTRLYVYFAVGAGRICWWLDREYKRNEGARIMTMFLDWASERLRCHIPKWGD